MDTYISLTQLMGRGTNYRDLEKFYEVQYEANLKNLQTQRAYVDSLEEQAKYFEDQIAAGMELTETEQEQYEALQDALRDANSELASTTEAALSSLQAAYENSINAIFQELDASIAGTAGSLAALADQYAYYQEEQSRYVSTAKELYEVSKLNRNIEQSMEDATTSASKAKLKALQDEIKIMSEKNDLSEYDIEMMNLQYQLTLAQIALEEAQASKDTVRLTRDEDGNMAYQYTANQEKVSQAQQQYEDTLQSINDLAANRVSELEQQCLSAEQQYLQSAQEILLDTTLTDEQRTQKLEELSQRYSETLLYIQQQYQNASSALTQNQQTIAEHYGQALVNSMGEASTQMNSVIGNMIGNAQSHIDAFNEAIENGSMGAWKDYMDGVSALTNASGLTYDNLIANADDYKQVADDANKAAQDLIKTFKDSFEDVNSATEEWDAHLATLTGVQTMYENIATSAQNALTVLSGFTAGEGVGDTSAAIAAMLGLTATTQNGAPTPGSSKPPLGDSTNNLVEGAPELLEGIPELMSGIPEINAALMAGIPEMYEELMAGIPEMYAELMAGIPEMNEELISGIPEMEEQLTSAITEVLADPALTAEARAKKLDEYNVLIDTLAKYEEAKKEMELEKLSGKVGSAGGGGGSARREDTTDLIGHAALTNQEMQMVEEMLLMQMQSFYAAQASVLGGGGGSNISIDKGSNLEQMIEIKADFPNATDQNEIKAAFEELINLASQHAYSSAAVQKSY